MPNRGMTCIWGAMILLIGGCVLAGGRKPQSHGPSGHRTQPVCVEGEARDRSGRPDVVRWVDPRIGTAGHGHTYPGPALPFGMVQVGPDTRLAGWDGCSGYHDSDSHVYGFSHTHLSGTGCSDYGDILLSPEMGEIRWGSAGSQGGRKACGSSFRHETEVVEAGYYKVDLDTFSIQAELTATLRTAFHRYTFPRGKAHILIDLCHRDTVLAASLRVSGPSEVEGMRRSRAWAADQPIFFVARFSRPFDAVEIASGGRVLDGVRQAEGKDVKAALCFRTHSREAILVKVGISAVSVEGARKNLEAENSGWDFEAVRSAARDTWNRCLGRIEVEGGSKERLRTFYTALYHSFLQPNLFTDVDGQYHGGDGKTHLAAGYTHYTLFSLWDTFRATHPLLTLLEPERTTDFVRTFLSFADQTGHLPVWELSGNETWCMIGYHAVPVMADAWLKGIRGFDGEAALQAMVRDARANRGGLEAYRRFGYIPSNLEPESVSKTLEYAYDDACIAAMASSLGKADVAREFALRSQSWRNVLDPETGFMRGRANGRLITPFDPAEVNFRYTEANAWQYSFFVPHDLEGFMKALGGPGALSKKLDGLFTASSQTSGRDQADITGLIGQYAHGNEPSHHVAYLYNFVGEPWKTQRMVRRILDEQYGDRPDGLCGNDDCGQMSAWYVLSALGFYPVNPCGGQYVLGSPLFDRAVLHFPDGKSFTIQAPGAGTAPCVQSVLLNGQPYSRSFISHQDLVKGGELIFRMGKEPNRAWGAEPGDRPATSVPGPRLLSAPYVTEGARVFARRTRVSLACPEAGAEIRYTVDGSDPTPESPCYLGPFEISSQTVVKAVASLPGWRPSHIAEADFYRRESTWTLSLATHPNPQYRAGGDSALIDGFRGGDDFRSGEWQGYEKVDLDATVDLGAPRDVLSVSLGCLQDIGSWIFLPSCVEVLVSTDGRIFRPFGKAVHDVPLDREGTIRHDFRVEGKESAVRFVRVVARNVGKCPPGHRGDGGAAFLFADEIEIR